jgi:hypothetical protein
VDIDDQAVNNYTYDPTGNLISDVQGGVTNIIWNAYGKVERITRSNGQIIVFGYDGMQNRIMKAVRTGVDTVFTFYVRDAQGNVLGVYNRTTAATPTITWAEQYIYGSGRLGSINPGLAWTAASTYAGLPFAVQPHRYHTRDTPSANLARAGIRLRLISRERGKMGYLYSRFSSRAKLYLE